ncbi:putative ferulic acid Esterase/Feruloyl esterase [Xylogone sp. PMI_703]|nr:putative ferulic acid Esterase/Feruloyl esterase [Xylogone sp. PMI_703]
MLGLNLTENGLSGTMKLSQLLLQSFAAGTGALECNVAAFSNILPSAASIQNVTSIAAGGSFGGGADNPEFPASAAGLPELCAVTVNVLSSNVSSYNFGLFLPREWNSRFITVGNGGFGGGINWPDMGTNSLYGFASMSTDTGHISGTADGSWALNNPEGLIDWGYRAMHGSVELSKQLIEAYYGSPARYNYYLGCSTGGRQGLKEVQFYPDDFDGVVAGAPAWWTSHLQPWTTQIGKINLPADAPYSIPASLLPVIEAEVFRQCDPQDGLRDNVISDPAGCNFNPMKLLCRAGANTSNCLTAPQLGTLYKLHHDYVETNQTFVFPAYALGSEAQWDYTVTVPEAPNTLGTDYIADFLVNNSNWNWETYDYSYVQLADKINPGQATANDFDMSPFSKKGGKLLQYHGWADGYISTGSSIYFHDQVSQTLIPKGVELDDWYRFFLVPGMQHCGGSVHDAPWYFAGASQALTLSPTVHSTPGYRDSKHDIVLAIMDWVENGVAPDEIIATKFTNDKVEDGVLRQRPLCPYPKQATWNGRSDPDRASSWKCEDLY